MSMQLRRILAMSGTWWPQNGVDQQNCTSLGIITPSPTAVAATITGDTGDRDCHSTCTNNTVTSSDTSNTDIMINMQMVVRMLVLLLTLSGLLVSPVAGKCRDEPARDCEAICVGGDPTRNCTIRVLVLLPDDNLYLATLQRVLPILKVAEQQIRAQALIPPHIDFEWLPHDTNCDAALAMIRAMDGIVKECAHVIFGPVCDYSLAAVSRITKYFNSEGTPLISVGGSTYDFEQKKTDCDDEFYMLLRTGMLSFETISELTINVMKRHNWSHSILYYERDGQRSVAGMHTCFLMMKSLGRQMRNENMTFAQYPLEPNLMNRTEEMRREIGNKHSSE